NHCPFGQSDVRRFAAEYALLRRAWVEHVSSARTRQSAKNTLWLGFMAVSAEADFRSIDKHGEHAAEAIPAAKLASSACVGKDLDAFVPDRIFHLARLDRNVTSIPCAIANSVDSVLRGASSIGSGGEFERHKVWASRLRPRVATADRHSAC